MRNQQEIVVLSHSGVVGVPPCTKSEDSTVIGTSVAGGRTVCAAEPVSVNWTRH
jgi:hypothetical protein